MLGQQSQACTEYKSYFYGNDLAVGQELLIMYLSSVFYLLLLLFLESVYWQRVCEKANTLYYKIRDRNSYSIDHDDGHHENGRYERFGLYI